MKKLSTIIMALALVLGMSQCKKQETPATGNTTPTNPGVHITVNVGDQDGKDGKDNNGEKHNIAPAYGLFAFTQGDVLYVGHNKKYVGMLTFNGACFDGTIYPDQDPTVTDNLHFYFVGNAAVTGTTVANQTTSLSINIANQSTNLPVLSYGASTKSFTGTGTTYSTTLRNQCALVRINLLTETTDAITLSNVPTQATIDFVNNAITPTNTTGNITLYGEEGVGTHRWAILLPGTVLSGRDDLKWQGGGEGMPSIGNNTYVNAGIGEGIQIQNQAAVAAPDAQYAVKKSNGDLSQFTVNANGKKVYFSKANLRFVGFNNNTGSWSFHENQVDASYAPDYGDNNMDIPSDESTNDRFAWGLYGNHGMYEDDFPEITTNLSKADGNDWGCAFSETSPEGDNWRTLTIDEWNYLFNGRSQQKRFLKVTLRLSDSELPNAVQGILLFPDDYVEPAGLTKTFTYNSNTSASTGSGYVVADADKFINAPVYTDPTSNSYKMLAAGAVFLPAAGYRIQQWYQMYYCHQPGSYTAGLKWDAYGYYWSSTSGVYNQYEAKSRAFYFDRSRVGEASSYQDRSHGMCVRLVWDAN